MAIQFKIENEAQFKAGMAKINRSLNKRKQVNAAALTVVDRWVKKNFQTEGGNVGGWAKLDPATIKARRSGDNKSLKGKTMKLQDSGDLRKKWSFIVSDKEAIYREGIKEGNKLYGTFHDKGTKRIPQRRILPTMEEMAPTLKKVYESFIKKAVK